MNLGWQEITAHRVLIVTFEQLVDEYELLNAEGQPPRPPIERAEFAIRLRDRRIFKISPWQPHDGSGMKIMALVEA